MTADIPPLEQETEVRALIERELALDIGPGDATTLALVPAGAEAAARIEARQELIVAGGAIAAEVFRIADPGLRTEILIADGCPARNGDMVMRVQGPARTLLAAERTALNLLQRMTGIATATKCLVRIVADYGTLILDTRKTPPGLRRLDKYAVTCGGGTNHRIGLHDAVLIKENHIAAAGGVTAVLRAAGQVAAQAKFIEIEVETLEQLQEALDAGAKMVLLDNMPLPTLREAVRINAAHPGGGAILEISGGVTLAGLRELAETGVDRISIGTLTKDVKATDFSMRLQELS